MRSSRSAEAQSGISRIASGEAGPRPILAEKHLRVKTISAALRLSAFVRTKFSIARPGLEKGHFRARPPGRKQGAGRHICISIITHLPQRRLRAMFEDPVAKRTAVAAAV